MIEADFSVEEVDGVVEGWLSSVPGIVSSNSLELESLAFLFLIRQLGF